MFSEDIQRQFHFYLSLLEKWQGRVNLISAKTFPDAWERHVLDSAQIASYLHASDVILDVGSGAGFPGLVLSIMGFSSVHLLEPSYKKTLFLQEVVSSLCLPAKVHRKCIENFEPPEFPTILTSRAFASIDKIFFLSSHLKEYPLRYVLLKGASFHEDICDAEKKWNFKLEIYPSLTHPSGRILVFSEVYAKNG
ncbi:MAG: 16S rRNA (guanine(527)-N(7))-methyltransferase RsmG [Alphaproteobacteria bacterium]